MELLVSQKPLLLRGKVKGATSEERLLPTISLAAILTG